MHCVAFGDMFIACALWFCACYDDSWSRLKTSRMVMDVVNSRRFGYASLPVDENPFLMNDCMDRI